MEIGGQADSQKNKRTEGKYEFSSRIGGHKKRCVHPHRRWRAQTVESQRPALSPAGKCTTSKVRPPTRTASMPRRPAAGSARSSSVPTTAARRGRLPAAGRRLRPGHAQGREQQVCLRGRSGHAQMVRRHAAPVGVQARLASRTFAHRPGHRLRRRGGRGAFQDHGRRQNVARVAGAARRERPSLAARRRRHGASTQFCSIRRTPNGFSSPFPPAGRFRTDDGGQTWKPDQPRLEIALRAARPGRRSRPLRSSHRPASVAAGRLVHAKALGRDAHRQRGRVVE